MTKLPDLSDKQEFSRYTVNERRGLSTYSR